MTQLSIAFQRHSETSRTAAESIEPSAGTLRAKVLELLRETALHVKASSYLPPEGLTDEQIQARLEMPASTQRPRRVELVRAGLVRDSGRTRPTRSGRQAVIWEAV